MRGDDDDDVVVVVTKMSVVVDDDDDDDDTVHGDCNVDVVVVDGILAMVLVSLVGC
jgi:hypothetical protein